MNLKNKKVLVTGAGTAYLHIIMLRCQNSDTSQ